MKLLRRSRDVEVLPGVTGVARVGRRTQEAARRLRPGDVAVLDHLDLDRVTADLLVARGVAAVVNASPSTSGRYPNLGPEVLVTAGIPLVDGVGRELLGAVRDGDRVRVHGGEVFVGERLVGTGTVQTVSSVEAAAHSARAGLASQLDDFAANSTEYLLAESALLLDGVGVPALRTALAGRHAVVVVRGYDHAADLAALRPYLREERPVLIGVDEGADALVEAGYRPDLVVGDLLGVSDAVLTSGAELVVRATPDGWAPGLDRAHALGVDATVFATSGTPEDAALLLADEAGAELVVTVGTASGLLEFLDRGRTEMASSFLTRLRLGSKLVDAEGAARLHRPRLSTWSLIAMVLAALAAMLCALLLSPAGQTYASLGLDALPAVGLPGVGLPEVDLPAVDLPGVDLGGIGGALERGWSDLQQRVVALLR